MIQGGIFLCTKTKKGGLKEMNTPKQDTKQFTEENDLLKQFMELLNQQNMGEQSQDFMELFKCQCFRKPETV